MPDSQILDRSRISTVDHDNPWPGPEAFREADATFFFGRDAAVKALTRLVVSNKLVIVYGRSGLGKTSLLQAGLFPKLREAFSLPVPIRMAFGHAGDTVAGLRSQVKSAIESAAATASVDRPELDVNKTMWEWFYRTEARFFGWEDPCRTGSPDEASKRVRPVLVFDQFEEAFTHGRTDAASWATTTEFFEELIDLIRGSPPTSVAAELESHPAAALEFSTGRDPCAIVISLRQEFLAELLRLRPRLPTLLDHRYEVSGMTQSDAQLVVTGPGGHLMEPGVPELIVSFVARARRSVDDLTTDDTTVDPAILSIFCRELNNKRQEPPPIPRISQGLVTGVQDQIIGDFYERCVALIGVDGRCFIEKRLVLESGFRNSAAVEEALRGGLTQASIDALIDSRLLRLDGKGPQARLELTHDVLTEPVVRSRRLRDLRDAEEAAQRALAEKQRKAQEAREREWQEREQQAKQALLERDLENARLEKELLEQRAREWKTRLGRVLLAVVLAALLMGFWVYWGRLTESERRLEVSNLVTQIEAFRKSADSPLDLSLLLAIEALQRAPSLETAQLVREISALLPRPVGRVELGGRVLGIVIDSRDDRAVTFFNGAENREAALWTLSPTASVGLLKHNGDVNGVAFSSDGSLVATVGADYKARLWDRQGKQVAEIDHAAALNDVMFRPGTRTFATVADDGLVRVWDATQTGSAMLVGQGNHETPVHVVAFNSRGDLLATSGETGVRIWSVAPNGALREVRSLTQNQPAVALQFAEDPATIARQLQWPPTDEVLVCADIGNNLKVWSLPRNASTRPPPPVVSRVDGLTTLPQDHDSDVLLNLLFVVGRDTRAPIDTSAAARSTMSLVPSELGLLRLSSSGQARLFTGDSTEPRETARFIHDGHVVAAAVSHSARLVITGDDNGSLLVWSIDPRFDSVSADGRRAAVIVDHSVEWRDSPYSPPFASLPWPGPSRRPEAIAVSPDGALIAAADKDRAVTWSPEKGATISQATLRAPEDARQASRDRVLPPLSIAAGSLLIPRTRALQVFDAASMKVRWDLVVNGIESAILSPDARYIAGLTIQRGLLVWSTAKPPTDEPTQIAVDGLMHFAFSPMESVLGVCAERHALFYDLSQPMPVFSDARAQQSASMSIQPMWSKETPCRALTFDRTGQRLAIGTNEGAVEVVDWSTRTTRAIFRAQAPIAAAAFSRSGEYLAAAGDGVLHVWNSRGEEELHFQASAVVAGPPSLAFSQDDRFILADGAAVAWRAEDVIRQACARLTRTLSADVKKYVPDSPGNRCEIPQEIQSKR
jgi:WD40 repeat protein